MRILQLKLHKRTETLLEAKAKTYGVRDLTFVQDLYCLFKLRVGSLPDYQAVDELAAKVAKKAKVSVLTARIVLRKRLSILKGIVKMPYFKALAVKNESNPFDSVNSWLQTNNEMRMKFRESKCRTCTLLNSCQFGMETGSQLMSLRNVANAMTEEDFSKVHESCPVIPSSFEEESAAAFKEVEEAVPQTAAEEAEKAELSSSATNLTEEIPINAFADIQDITDIEDEAEEDAEDNMTTESGHGYFGTGPKNAAIDYIGKIEGFVNKLSETQLALYELAKKIDLEMGKQCPGKFVPTTKHTPSKTGKFIDKVADVPKLQAAQFGLPDQVFEARLDKKTLVKNQNMENKERKFLYILLDSSGSMHAALPKGPFGVFSRLQLAYAFCYAIIKNAERDGGIVYFRFFETWAGRLCRGSNPQEFKELYRELKHGSGGGGGTNIPVAIKTAMQDIQNARQEFDLAKCEVLCITDAECPVDATDIKKMRGEIPLYSLDVTPKRGAFSDGGLEQASDKYYRINTRKNLVSELVNLIK